MKVGYISFLLLLYFSFPFRSVNVCFIYVGAPFGYINIYKCDTLLLESLLNHYMITFLSLIMTLGFKSVFFYICISFPGFLLISSCMYYLYPYLHYQTIKFPYFHYQLKVIRISCRQYVVGCGFYSVSPFPCFD